MAEAYRLSVLIVKIRLTDVLYKWIRLLMPLDKNLSMIIRKWKNLRVNLFYFKELYQCIHFK